MTDQAIAPDLAPASTREWVFTFGYGQRLHAARCGQGAVGAVGDGLALDDCYIRIRAASAKGARAEMIRLFGMAWSSQYPELPTGPGIRYRADLTALLAG